MIMDLSLSTFILLSLNTFAEKHPAQSFPFTINSSPQFIPKREQEGAEVQSHVF